METASINDHLLKNNNMKIKGYFREDIFKNIISDGIY